MIKINNLDDLRDIENKVVTVDGEGDHKLLPEAISEYQALREKASRNGFKMTIVSSYRSINHQITIWNKKALGERPIFGDSNEIFSPTDMSKLETIQRIMRFSALPTTSRHHWGTDFDVYDANAINYKDLLLTPSECKDGGALCDFHNWLSEELPRTSFFRPYSEDKGGVSPEMWHLSFSPLSLILENNFHEDLYKKMIEKIDLELKDAILEDFPSIYQRFLR